MPNVYPDAQDLVVLNALAAADGYLDGAVVKLFQNDIVPTPATALGDLTVATFSGYAASAVLDWGAGFIDTDGVAKLAAASVNFLQTADTVVNTVYGYYVVGDPGGTPYLIFANRFTTPVHFSGPGLGINVDPEFNLDRS